MRITLAAVGRAKAGPAHELYEFYAGRLAWPLTLKEVEERRALPPKALKAREAELLLAALPRGARLVALDETGRNLTSSQFAGLIGRWRDEGVQDVAIAVGGAEGLAETVREQADLVLALGAMTWPHLLVRGMIAEQLYRAQTILAGHPYHRA
ncbi:MAG: 23S rRNA (pseudouridine(1915)-N(3))-methyltransferase RlmH [Alphaproteobacteria bacterium]|nr:23S rRNA (pseudouridine(1915)-N(3))-methyltransferase RlmH [Alphaproteobacteria bacterium]